MTETAHDFFDRYAISMKGQNGGIGILAPQKTFIL
jgi:hypothetical protein